MTIDAASGASPYASLVANSNVAMSSKLASSASTGAATASSKTLADKDTFLKLLVAQLKYQDPSKPADSTEFMSQTAQFSSLETLQAMSTTNTAMVSSQQRLQASALVGRTVTYLGDDGKPVSGTVTSASFTAATVGGTGGEPVLKVGGKDVVLSKVSSVEAPSTAQSQTGSTS